MTESKMDITEMIDLPYSAHELAFELKKLSDKVWNKGMRTPAPNTVYGYKLEEIKAIIDYAISKGYNKNEEI